MNEENKEEQEAEVVVTESVKEFNEEVNKWVARFDKDFKEAVRLMGLPAADEKKPFEEKYQARALLEALTKDLEGKQEWLDQSMLIRCGKATILNKLGTNYYDAEEISQSERHNQQALTIWLTVSKGMQLRFTAQILDTYNGIGIVLANR